MPITTLRIPSIWGSHTPNDSATCQTRLRCVLLDFLTSADFPTLSHSPGPYFRSYKSECYFSRTFDLSNPSERSPFLCAGLDNIPAVKFILFRIFLHSDCQPPSERIYILEARMSVVDKDFKPIHPSILLANFKCLQPLETSIGLRWVMNDKWLVDGAQDVLYSMDWRIVVAIFQHQARIRFADDGEPHDALIYDLNLEENPDPLKHLGLMGWPTVTNGVWKLMKRI